MSTTAPQAPALLHGRVGRHGDGRERHRRAATSALLRVLVPRESGSGGHLVSVEDHRVDDVHVVHVVLELVLPLKGGAAVEAVEGAGIGVGHHVLGQSLLDAEALVALGAPVRLLTFRTNG